MRTPSLAAVLAAVPSLAAAHGGHAETSGLLGHGLAHLLLWAVPVAAVAAAGGLWLRRRRPR